MNLAKKGMIMIAVVLAAGMVLTACSNKANENSTSSSNVSSSASQSVSNVNLAQVIVGARSSEDNEVLEVLTGKKGESASYGHNPNDVDSAEADSAAEMVFTTLNIKPEDLEEYAFSISLVNIKAYAVGIFKPVSEKAQEVKNALEEYLKNTQNMFERYLEDQYEIAKDAKLKELSDGTILLVMSENSNEVLSKIEKALS